MQKSKRKVKWIKENRGIIKVLLKLLLHCFGKKHDEKNIFKIVLFIIYWIY